MKKKKFPLVTSKCACTAICWQGILGIVVPTHLKIQGLGKACIKYGWSTEDKRTPNFWGQTAKL